MKKVKFVTSNVGEIGVCEQNGFITNIFFGGAFKPKNMEIGNSKLLEAAEIQIKEYFLGKRKVFDLPIKIEGTEFQKLVWQSLLKIPYGKVSTYKQISVLINQPNAFRAVGLACGKNPILLIVPCHRVVAENGNLSGFAGGINAKQNLLNLEQENS